MNTSATELSNIISKYCLLHELLIFKYWRQNISLSNIVLHTAVRHSSVRKWRNERKQEYVRQCIMKHQTSPLQLCGQLTVLTLTPSTTRFWGSCRSVCTAARFVTSSSWSHAWSKSGNISTRWSSMKYEVARQWGMGTTSSSLRLSTRWTFWTQTLGVLTSCHSHGRTLDSQSRLCLSSSSSLFGMHHISA